MAESNSALYTKLCKQNYMQSSYITFVTSVKVEISCFLNCAGQLGRFFLDHSGEVKSWAFLLS